MQSLSVYAVCHTLSLVGPIFKKVAPSPKFSAAATLPASSVLSRNNASFSFVATVLQKKVGGRQLRFYLVLTADEPF